LFQKLNKNRGGFTLVEIMIVVGIIALLAAIAVPNFLRARKRSQGTRCLEDLRILTRRLTKYAIENNRSRATRSPGPTCRNYIEDRIGPLQFPRLRHVLAMPTTAPPRLGGFDPKAELDEFQQALGRVSGPPSGRPTIP